MTLEVSIREIYREQAAEAVWEAPIHLAALRAGLSLLRTGTELLFLPLVHPKITIGTETSPGRCWCTAIVQRAKHAEAKELS